MLSCFHWFVRLQLVIEITQPAKAFDNCRDQSDKPNHTRLPSEIESDSGRPPQNLPIAIMVRENIFLGMPANIRAYLDLMCLQLSHLHSVNIS